VVLYCFLVKDAPLLSKQYIPWLTGMYLILAKYHSVWTQKGITLGRWNHGFLHNRTKCFVWRNLVLDCGKGRDSFGRLHVSGEFLDKKK
jgi:hypothetical protein